MVGHSAHALNRVEEEPETTPDQKMSQQNMGVKIVKDLTSLRRGAILKNAQVSTYFYFTSFILGSLCIGLA